MRSHLTRDVFHRLIANEPIIHRGCLRRHAPSHARSLSIPSRRSSIRPAPYRVMSPHRRTFFNLNMFGPNKRSGSAVDMDPGLDQMIALAKMERLVARKPPVEKVAAAFRTFFRYKKSNHQSIEDNQAQLALQSLRFCLPSHSVNSTSRNAMSALLTEEDLATAADVLQLNSELSQIAHRDLACALCERLQTADAKLLYKGIVAYVSILNALAEAEKARDTVLGFEARIRDLSVNGENDSDDHLDGTKDIEDQESPSELSTTLPELWVKVLWTYANHRSEEEVLNLLEMMRSKNIHRPGDVSQAMLWFYIRHDDLAKIREYFAKRLDGMDQSASQPKEAAEAMARDVHGVLQWCLKTNNINFGHETVRLVLRSNPPKLVWDAIFFWAAGTGKGPDEIDRMIGVMEHSNKDIADRGEWRHADSATINGLVALATSQDDPYLAERFLTIGRNRGIEPDVWTYVLQIEYRLKVRDVDGALIAYQSLQTKDLSRNDDVKSVNNLIVALCNSRRHDFDTIMNVAADLAERRVRFEPLTVSTLCVLHLGRDEMHDVFDLLNTYITHFSSAERASIRDRLVSYCLNPTTDITRAWDTYAVLRTTFEETPRSDRTDIMVNFFSRGRPDMAVHVFNGMKTQTHVSIAPNVDTYVSAFLNAAKIRDIESLEIIHNQLKLDFNIEINTYLRNALMASYTACGRPRMAIDFWYEVLNSKEGPSYNSLHIVFRACEKLPYGHEKAKDIWNKLRRLKIELDTSLWASYAAAFASNGNTTTAISTITEAVEKRELEVDAFLIGSVFAGCSGQTNQSEVEAWARDCYPAEWDELMKLGVDSDENGMRTFRIDRSLTPNG